MPGPVKVNRTAVLMLEVTTVFKLLPTYFCTGQNVVSREQKGNKEQFIIIFSVFFLSIFKVPVT